MDRNPSTPLVEALIFPVDGETGEPLLTAEQCAQLRGVSVNTWHRSVARGSYPPPDGHVGRTPVWRESSALRRQEREPQSWGKTAQRLGGKHHERGQEWD